MDEFLLQPALYTTGASEDLFTILDRVWVEPGSPNHSPGTYYVVSGFGTHNGGVRFFERFRHHVQTGGRVRALFGGSRSMNLTSRQLGEALIDCGAEVSVVNRRQIFHAKLYGSEAPNGDQHLVSTSGNFTPPGLRMNVEAVLSLGPQSTAALGFRWADMFESVLAGGLDSYTLPRNKPDDPAWSLLYDEEGVSGFRTQIADNRAEVTETIIQTLGHMDTVRINAALGTTAAKGSQYFFLSKDTYDYFPPLTIRNTRGRKATYSARIEINFRELGEVHDCLVTFEAENNLDFRLGTGPLRGTGLAADGDMAVLTRTNDATYDLRIVRQGTTEFIALARFALTHVGHRGKRFGYAPTSEVNRILGP